MAIARMTVTVVAILFLAVAPCLAGQVDPKVETQIKTFMADHAKAFGKKDLKTVMAMFAPGPNTVLLGTGPGQRWVGQDEIKAAHESFFETFDSESMKFTWVSVGAKADVAWFAAMCQVQQFYKGEQSDYPINWSGTLIKKDGKWLLVSSHFSNVASPEDYGMPEGPDTPPGENLPPPGDQDGPPDPGPPPPGPEQ